MTPTPAGPAVPPLLTDGTVTLRALRDADVDDLVATHRDPLTHRWTRTADDYGPGDAHRFLESVAEGLREGSFLTWAIEVDDGGRPRFAGQVDLRTGPPPSVGYVLAPWARGAGRMSRALRLVADHAFGELGLPVLHWTAKAGNLASWRVAHACGFRFEAVRTLALTGRDGPVDAWHAVLRPDPDVPVAQRAPETAWWPVPVLEGARVRLRPPAAHDVVRQVQSCTDPDSRWWSATLPHPYTDVDAAVWVRDSARDAALGRAVEWVIADRDDDRLLGTISVHGLDRPYTPTGGEVGYRAHPDARGRGVVSQALDLVVRHAFTPVSAGGLGRHRLGLGASRENAASRRVAERAGFRLVGEFRADGVHGLDNERVDDGVWYDLLADDPGRGPAAVV